MKAKMHFFPSVRITKSTRLVVLDSKINNHKFKTGRWKRNIYSYAHTEQFTDLAAPKTK